MARTILAAVAALCALASVSAISGLRDPLPEPRQLPPQLQQLSSQLGQQLEKALGSELLQSPQNLKEGGQELLQVYASCAQGLLTVVPRVLPTSLDDNTVNGIEQVLQALQSSDEVALEAAQQATVEPDALQIADQLDANVKEWLDKASLTGVDVSDCVDDQTANLTDVVKTFQQGPGRCINGILADLNVLREQIGTYREEAKRIIRSGTIDSEDCRERLRGHTVQEIGICEGNVVGRILLKVIGLSIDAVAVAVDSHSLSISASKCTASSALAKASHIANATISCIEGKLSSQSS